MKANEVPEFLGDYSGAEYRVGNKKIRCNQWGNYIGYIGSKKVENFSDQLLAREWLVEGSE